jgi:hypothetical protein
MNESSEPRLRSVRNACALCGCVHRRPADPDPVEIAGVRLCSEQIFQLRCHHARHTNGYYIDDPATETQDRDWLSKLAIPAGRIDELARLAPAPQLPTDPLVLWNVDDDTDKVTIAAAGHWSASDFWSAAQAAADKAAVAGRLNAATVAKWFADPCGYRRVTSGWAVQDPLGAEYADTRECWWFSTDVVAGAGLATWVEFDSPDDEPPADFVPSWVGPALDGSSKFAPAILGATRAERITLVAVDQASAQRAEIRIPVVPGLAAQFAKLYGCELFADGDGTLCIDPAGRLLLRRTDGEWELAVAAGLLVDAMKAFVQRQIATGVVT